VEAVPAPVVEAAPPAPVEAVPAPVVEAAPELASPPVEASAVEVEEEPGLEIGFSEKAPEQKETEESELSEGEVPVLEG
jgi:hypothetical protein